MKITTQVWLEIRLTIKYSFIGWMWTDASFYAIKVDLREPSHYTERLIAILCEEILESQECT